MEARIRSRLIYPRLRLRRRRPLVNQEGSFLLSHSRSIYLDSLLDQEGTGGGSRSAKRNLIERFIGCAARGFNGGSHSLAFNLTTPVCDCFADVPS
jgi:hypothetical protein